MDLNLSLLVIIAYILLGAVAGIIGGSDVAGKGAALGALSGGAQGLSNTATMRANVMRNCLGNRGYQVLN